MTTRVAQDGEHYKFGQPEEGYWIFYDISSNTLIMQSETTPGTFVDMISISDTEVVINDGSNNRDFRIESDDNANFAHFDASLNHIAFGAVADANFQFHIDPQAETRTSVANFFKLGICTSGAITVNAAIPILGGFFLGAPGITIGTGSVTDAVSLYVENAPTEGTRNYAFWVDSGITRLDGNVGIGTHTAHNTTAGTAIVSLFEGTAPAGTLANGASIFADVVTSDEVLRGIDSAGNVTTI